MYFPFPCVWKWVRIYQLTSLRVSLQLLYWFRRRKVLWSPVGRLAYQWDVGNTRAQRAQPTVGANICFVRIPPLDNTTTMITQYSLRTKIPLLSSKRKMYAKYIHNTCNKSEKKRAENIQQVTDWQLLRLYTPNQHCLKLYLCNKSETRRDFNTKQLFEEQVNFGSLHGHLRCTFSPQNK